MKGRRLFLAAALLPAVAAFPAPARTASKSAELDTAIEKRRFAEAVRLFGKIAKPTARDAAGRPTKPADKPKEEAKPQAAKPAAAKPEAKA